MAPKPLVHSTCDQETGIARIVLDRPDRLNAIDQALADEFRAAAQEAAGQDGLRCIVLQATGRAFCAGGDVATFADPASAGQAIDGLLASMHDGLVALKRAPAPVVTAVQGLAAGAGFALALCGDIVLAAESVRFSVAYTRLGGTPDCGLSWALSRRLGPARTLELLIDAAVIDAPAALKLGLVTQTFPDAEFEAAVEQRIAGLAAGPTRAFVACRDLLADSDGFEAQLARERAAFVAVAGTRDFGEGVAAFTARSEPAFAGR